MALPSLQQQAYLEATGFAQANWGDSGQDYGSVTFAEPTPEHIIYTQQGAFYAGVIDRFRLRSYYAPTREIRDLTPFVSEVTYTEAEGQAGVMGQLTFLDLSELGALEDWKDAEDFRSWIALVGLIMIWETAGPNRPLLERQRWIAWDNTVGEPGADTISFYDCLVYIANAQASFGYAQDDKHPAGWTASEITADICQRYNIPVKSIVRATYRIPYFLFTGSIFDAISTAYAFERHMTGKYFIVTSDQGKLVVRRMRSVFHNPKVTFLIDPKKNARTPMTFERTLDQFAGGIIPTGVDQAGDPSYIDAGNVDPSSEFAPAQGTADTASTNLIVPVPGVSTSAVVGASGVYKNLSAEQKRNQLASAVLFGSMASNFRLKEIRDPAYSRAAAQLASNRLARASKLLSVTVDGNVLLREADRVHIIGYPLDLFISSITQTVSQGDHNMQLEMAWREYEVSDMEDYHATQQAGAAYALSQSQAKGSVIDTNAKLSGNVTQASFGIGVLKALGVAKTKQNLTNMVGWEMAEGGNFKNNARYNPLNTKLKETGSTDSGGGIQAYTSWTQGLQATVSTITQPNMSAILAALQTGVSYAQWISVVAGSPWGTKASSFPSESTAAANA